MEIRESIKELINDFIRVWCDDYFNESKWTYEIIDAEFYATIELTCMHNEKYELPLCMDDGGDPAIDIGDSGTLELNGEGLFLWLWQENSNRYREYKEIMEC